MRMLNSKNLAESVRVVFLILL